MTKHVEREIPFSNGSTEVYVCETEVPTMRAKIALELLKHLAIATATPDGEDTAGRARLRLLTPNEIAVRACEIADETWNQFQARKWTQEIPLPKPSTPPAPKSRDTGI